MSKHAPTVGLSIVARDEAQTLPGLLSSVEGAFDQVALLDTGSADDTLRVFCDWGRRQGSSLPLGFKADGFEWCDDFAAARNRANALLGTDWIARADCDEQIDGARALRAIVSAAPPETVAFTFPFEDEADETFRVGRLARRGCAVWVGRIYEMLAIEGGNYLHLDYPVWMHRKPSDRRPRRGGRDLPIARKWAAEEPSPESLATAAMVELMDGSVAGAANFLRGYLRLPTVRRSLTREKIAAAEAAIARIEVSPPREAFSLLLSALGSPSVEAGTEFGVGPAEAARLGIASRGIDS